MAASSVVVRCCCAVMAMATFAACGGDDSDSVSGDAEATSSTSSPDTAPSEPVVPAELEFRPVLQLLPPGGVPAEEEGAGEGCTTPAEAWTADQPVLAPQVEDGEEIACMRLGPTDVGGGIVESATASDGGADQWAISLVLTSEGIQEFNQLAGDCFDAAATCPSRQLAIVLDREVISAPMINAPEFERDQISISGDFTQAEAEALAERLR